MRLTALASLSLLLTFAGAAQAAPTLTLGPAAGSPAARARTKAFDPVTRGLAVVRAALPAGSQGLALRATVTDRFGDGDRIVHFAQTHEGLPVIGRGASVRFSESGDTRLTAVELEEDLPASVVPALSAEAAVTTIAARVRVGVARPEQARLVVWPLAGGGSRLAYVIAPEIPAGLPTKPRFVVDAQTGKILEARDLVRFLNTAKVYEFNPTKTPTILPAAELPIRPDPSAAGKLTNAFVQSSNCIDNKTVKSVSFGGFMADVHVCDLQQTALANETADFVYEPTDKADLAAKSDEFSEVSMYYHATKAYAFFRTLAGTPDAQVVVDKPLRVIANLQLPPGIMTFDLIKMKDKDLPLETFQNAFFAPAGDGLGAIFEQIYGVSGGALWFGQGPVHDYAYDGDVVYHELTHAVVDDTLKLTAWHVDARGAVDAPGAMNEGLADYFSSAITGDPDVGEYASKDISPTLTVIRTLANDDKCPSAVAGEVHFDSTLFSGGLWTARMSLPEGDRTKFDAALYKAMRSSPGNGDLGYDDLTKLFLATLGTDLPAGQAALEKAMTDRGVLPSCERILEWKGSTIAGPYKEFGGFGTPGTQTVSFGKADVAPGIFQLHVPTTETASSVTLSFKVPAQSGGGNPLGGSGSPFAPRVLAKLGKPLTWTKTSGGGTNDADKAVDATGTGTMKATIDLPAGTRDVYLQIANTGETDGTYDDLAVTITDAPPPPPVNDAGVDPASPASSNDDGCGCSTPGSTSGRTGALGLFAGLAAVVGVVRRRRRSLP
ncbi:MAG: hypothetical protein JWP97_3134 [Labilithrix sp.]|nr:hypothetical protein [Labilithrix sp.]